MKTEALRSYQPWSWRGGSAGKRKMAINDAKTVGGTKRPNYGSLLGDRELFKQTSHDNAFIGISRSTLNHFY